MPAPTQAVLQPRKTPVQARSAASVDAILEATLQVLLAVGKERLTTTRVAERAGVSVGTLYQYFPNKSSLLQATLRRHFEGVVETVQTVCREKRGRSLAEMGVALAEGFLAAKIRDGQSSVALYAISDDVDGVEIAQEMRLKTQEAVYTLLDSASDRPSGDLRMVAAVLQGMLAGVSRQLLETANLEAIYPAYRQQLSTAIAGYLRSVALEEPR